MLYEQLQTRQPIHKGWSGDRKFRVTDASGRPYLLRLSPWEQFSRRQAQFRRMERAAEQKIPMCLPLEFGTCEEGVYMLHSWVAGQDALDRIPALPAAGQYAYGLEAGRILGRLHAIPAPAGTEDWALRFNRKIDAKIAQYRGCPLKYPGGEALLEYLSRSRRLLEGRPQTYQHGDYHIGNMMLDENGTLTIIDFDKDSWGIPGRNSTGSSGVPRAPRLSLPGRWTATSAGRSPGNSGICWPSTSAPTPWAPSPGPFPLGTPRSP